MKSIFRRTLLRPAVVLAACCPLLYCSPALAEGTAFAQLSTLQFSTLDLTPDDGIAAGYAISSVEPTFLRAYYRDGDTVVDEHSAAPGQPGTARVDFGASFAEGSTTGSIGGVSSQARASEGLHLTDHFFGSSYQQVWLTLRPNTVLIVSGHVDAVAKAETGSDGWEYGTSSLVEVRIFDEARHSVATMTRKAEVRPGEPSLDNELHDDFVLAYAHGGVGDIALSLDLATESRTYVSSTPVPEPETWAMLSGGLLLLGAARRYRRRA